MLTIYTPVTAVCLQNKTLKTNQLFDIFGGKVAKSCHLKKIQLKRITEILHANQRERINFFHKFAENPKVSVIR